jgi:hypothetical protein
MKVANHGGVTVEARPISGAYTPTIGRASDLGGA